MVTCVRVHNLQKRTENSASQNHTPNFRYLLTRHNHNDPESL